VFSALVAIFTVALGAGFWFDNAITHSYLQFWWVPLVAAYVLLCTQLPTTVHRVLSPATIASTAAILVLLSIWVFDDVLTVYLTGAIYLIAWGVAVYAANPGMIQSTSHNRTLVALIILTLVILPISVNRIQITLPNLSAGTTITLHESVEVTPDLDARFHNRLNDKFEIEAYLGSQIYFQQPHDAPMLEIETSLNKVVVRLMTISYQHRLAYLDLPLFELRGDDLLKIEVTEEGARVNAERDRAFLLLTGFEPGKPVWLQLPHMQHHDIALSNHALIVLYRVLLWLIICFAISVWLPRGQSLGRQTHAA